MPDGQPEPGERRSKASPDGYPAPWPVAPEAACDDGQSSFCAQRSALCFRMELFHMNRRRCYRTAFTENSRCPFKELTSSSVDDIRTDIKLRGQFGQRLLALCGSKFHLRLEGRTVVPVWSFRYAIFCSRHQGAFRRKRYSSNLYSLAETDPGTFHRSLSRRLAMVLATPPFQTSGTANHAIMPDPAPKPQSVETAPGLP